MAKKIFKKKIKKKEGEKRKKKKKTDTGSPYHSRSISFTNGSRISTPSDSGKRSQSRSLVSPFPPGEEA